ncbi:uncharacterized protein LOC129739166 [Uranotaenia lowii]|uniref:uncharacterized protein LOC129739166 n=1 Tax=Uranotaenia lowii TaxID=190385 RepID=UPI00247A8D28|nr:uncharacterized protein LOC129739166 [Uranotaenia lowii]
MNFTYGIMNSFVALWVLMYLGVECVNGGCLSYGHSCWGGHGKRSGPKIPELPADVGWPLGLKPVPDGGKSVVYGLPGKRPRGIRSRGLFPLSRAAMVELNGASQDEFYGDGEVDSLKSSEIGELLDGNGNLSPMMMPPGGVSNGDKTNSLRLQQQQQRRKAAAAAALLDSVVAAVDSPPALANGSSDDDEDDSFGRLLLSGPAGAK